jgi:predicted dehydrogenase
VPRGLLRVHSDVIDAYHDPTTVDPIGDDRFTMYVSELQEFVTALAEGRAPSVTGDDGLRVLDVLDAIVASAQSQTPVTLAQQRATPILAQSHASSTPRPG